MAFITPDDIIKLITNLLVEVFLDLIRFLILTARFATLPDLNRRRHFLS